VQSVLRESIRQTRQTRAAPPARTVSLLLEESPRAVHVPPDLMLAKDIPTATPARPGLTLAPQLLSAFSATPEPTRTRTTPMAASVAALAHTLAKGRKFVRSAPVESISRALAKVVAPAALLAATHIPALALALRALVESMRALQVGLRAHPVLLADTHHRVVQVAPCAQLACTPMLATVAALLVLLGSIITRLRRARAQHVPLGQFPVVGRDLARVAKLESMLRAHPHAFHALLVTTLTR